MANFCVAPPQVLANLLETEDAKCKTGSLRILSQITVHPSIRRKTTIMGGIELLIKILSDPDKELQVACIMLIGIYIFFASLREKRRLLFILKLLAGETMANLAKFKKARTIVRKNGGIPKLIDLLDLDLSKVAWNEF